MESIQKSELKPKTLFEDSNDGSDIALTASLNAMTINKIGIHSPDSDRKTGAKFEMNTNKLENLDQDQNTTDLFDFEDLDQKENQSDQAFKHDHQAIEKIDKVQEDDDAESIQNFLGDPAQVENGEDHGSSQFSQNLSHSNMNPEIQGEQGFIDDYII